jgi:hypothetical protein
MPENMTRRLAIRTGGLAAVAAAVESRTVA